jgi:hypothetical protein
MYIELDDDKKFPGTEGVLSNICNPWRFHSTCYIQPLQRIHTLLRTSITASTQSTATSQSLYACLISMMNMHNTPMITKSYRKKKFSIWYMYLYEAKSLKPIVTHGQETLDRIWWFITVATGSNPKPAASSQKSHILFEICFNIILPPTHSYHKWSIFFKVTN